MEQQIRVTLGELKPNAGRTYDVTIMRPGRANGYTFPPEILRQAATLFETATSFVDHTNLFDHPSIRDVCGVIHHVWFDDSRSTIRGQYDIADSPGGELVQRIADAIVQLRADGKPAPNIGLSADVALQCDQQLVVTAILKVNSVDVVFDPAAGGLFERVLNSVQRTYTNFGATPRGGTMPEPTTGANAPAAPTPPQPGLAAAIQSESLARLQAASTEELLRLQCANTLSSTLAASDLPEAYKTEIRRQFANRTFQPSELAASIEGLRGIWAQTQEALTVQHYGHATDGGRRPIVHGMVTDMERLTLAAERMFGLPIPPDKADIPKLSGIRELYHLLSGDYEMLGVFDAKRVTFANATTTTMASLVANVMNKLIKARWEELGREGYDWYTKIAAQEDVTNLNDVRWNTVGGFGDLPTVAEGAAYTELTWDDKYETAAFLKKGGFIGLTLEMLDRDETNKVKGIPRALATAGIRTLSSVVAALFTTNGNLVDGTAWFHSTSALRGGDGATAASGNLATTALAAAEWAVRSANIFKQAELNSSKRLGLRPAWCLIPIDLIITANDIFKNDWVVTDNKHYQNLLKGTASPLVVPDWTDANDWYAVTDPAIYPTVGIAYRFGRMPEVFISGDETVGSMFTNDELRIKSRFLFCASPIDWRGTSRSTVA